MLVDDASWQALNFPDVMEESAGRIDAEILLAKFDEPHLFSPSALATANLGFSNNAWWLHSRLQSSATASVERILLLNNPLMRDVAFYLRHDDGQIESIAASSRNGSPHATIRIPPKGSEIDVFVRVQSQHPLLLPLALYTPDEFAGQREVKILRTGLVIGLLAALVAYNLLLAVSLRKLNYRWLSLHLFSFALFLLAVQGFGDDVMLRLTGASSTNLFYATLSFAMFGMLAYTSSLLGLSSQLPMAGRVIRGMAMLRLLLAALALLLPAQWLAQLSVALVIPDALAISTPAVILALRGNKPARLLLLAWTVLLVLLVADCLLAFGLVQAVGVVTTGLVLAIVIGAAVITFASVLHYESMHQKYETATRQSETTIELNVAERTRSLTTTMAALNDANQRLRDANDRDGLTGVYNRRYFDRMIEPLMARSRATKQCFSALVADVDHFKRVNDSAGHLTGDDCIRMVADTMRQHLHTDQPLIRYGGEEFVVLLPDMQADKAIALAQCLRMATAAAHVEHEGAPLRVTISIGIATVSANERVSSAALIRHADTALYAAKSEGRNRVIHAGPIKHDRNGISPTGASGRSD